MISLFFLHKTLILCFYNLFENFTILFLNIFFAIFLILETIGLGRKNPFFTIWLLWNKPTIYLAWSLEIQIVLLLFFWQIILPFFFLLCMISSFRFRSGDIGVLSNSKFPNSLTLNPNSIFWESASTNIFSFAPDTKNVIFSSADWEI